MNNLLIVLKRATLEKNEASFDLVEKSADYTKDEEKIKAFSELDSIDDVTAVLLYDNGFTSMDDLKKASVKDIAKIKAIKKKTAKEIVKELKELYEKPVEKKPSKKEKKKKLKNKEYIPKDEELNQKIDTFKDLESINGTTVILLFNNGYISTDDLKEATLKDLTKIKGVKKKVAKKIIEEIKEIYGA